MAAAKLKYTVTIVSWQQALTLALSEPNTLIYSLNYTEERAPKFHWILALKQSASHLFGRNEPKILALSQQEILAGNYRGICEAKSQQCAWLEQYGFPAYRILKPVETTVAERVKLILRGRADFIVAEPEVIYWHIDVADIPANSLVSYGMVYTGITDYLAANENTDPEIISRLTEAAKNIPLIEAAPVALHQNSNLGH